MHESLKQCLALSNKPLIVSSAGSQGDVTSCSQLHANLRPVKLEYPDTQIHSQILISLIPG